MGSVQCVFEPVSTTICSSVVFDDVLSINISMYIYVLTEHQKYFLPRNQREVMSGQTRAKRTVAHKGNATLQASMFRQTRGARLAKKRRKIAREGGQVWRKKHRIPTNRAMGNPSPINTTKVWFYFNT